MSEQRKSRVIEKTVTVFIADDDDAFRAILKDALLAHGYAVEDVGDGARALEALSMVADGFAPPPDVVVLDVRMPGYSGLGILNVMRRFAMRPPTLLLTAATDASIDMMARTMGACGVLHKPISLDEVLEAVRDAAARGGARANDG